MVAGQVDGLFTGSQLSSQVFQFFSSGVANKEAAAKLSEKVAALAGAGNSARQAENITCMDFAAEVIVAATSISLAPLSPGLQQTLLDLVAMVVIAVAVVVSRATAAATGDGQ